MSEYEFFSISKRIVQVKIMMETQALGLVIIDVWNWIEIYFAFAEHWNG